VVQSDAPHGDPWRRQAGPRDPREARTRTDQSSTTKEARKIPRCCRAKGKSCETIFDSRNQRLACRRSLSQKAAYTLALGV